MKWGRHRIFSVVAVVLVFSAGFISLLTAQPALALTDAQITQKADSYCRLLLADGDKELAKKVKSSTPGYSGCTKGYRTFYKDGTQATYDTYCNGFAVGSKENAYCLQARTQARKDAQTESSSSSSGSSTLPLAQIQKIAEGACTNKYGSKELQTACQKGYVAGYQGGSKNVCDADKSWSTKQQTECKVSYEDGKNAEKAGVTQAQPPKTYSAPSDDAEDDPDSACESGAVSFGWLLCPAINLANKTIEAVVDNIIIPELEVRRLSFSKDNNTYVVWGNIRTLANVFFVLIFLVMIFANTLSINLNAYTIKKMIPKLAAAAILVQFSYVICAVVVDIGNVLGVGIAELVSVTLEKGTGADKGSTFAYLGGAIVDIGIGAAIISAVGVATLVGVAIAGFFSVMGVLFTVVARQLIILMLIVTAPIAFAAMVLPSTEKFFKQWLETFIKVVLMFPLIIFLLSVANLGVAVTKDGHSKIEALLAALFPIIAFFMIPATFAWAGKIMGGAAAKIMGTGGKLGGKTRGAWEGSRAAQGLKSRRHDRKEDKLREAIDHGGLRGWAAGVRTRGDFLGGRSLELRNGRPTLHGERAAVLQRERTAQARQIHAKHVSDLREQYQDLSTEELWNIMNDPHNPMSPLHAEAITGVVAKRGAGDQGRFFARMQAIHQAAGQSDAEIHDAVGRVRDQNFGNILGSNPVLAGMNANDTMITVDQNGQPATHGGMDLGEESALRIMGLTGDKLANQTGRGWDTIMNSQVQRQVLQDFVTNNQNSQDQAVLARVQQVNAVLASNAGPTINGLELVSGSARDALQNTPVLRGKVLGTEAGRRLNIQ